MPYPSTLTSRLPSTPNIPVRMTRAIVLRRLMAAHHGDDVGSVKSPPKAEVSAHVMGLNKAVHRGFQKHVHSWYREQTMVLERMDRHQNRAYENLLRLQREREGLTSYVDLIRKSNQRPSGQQHHDEAEPVTAAEDNNEETTADVTENSAQSPIHQITGDAVTSADVSNAASPHNKLPNIQETRPVKVKPLTAPDPAPPSPMLAKLQAHQPKPHLSAQVAAKNEQISSGSKTSTSGASKTHSPLMTKSMSESLPHISTNNTSQTNIVHSAHRSTSDLVRTSSDIYLDITPIGNHPVPGKDFVCYHKSPRGEIIKAEFPYKRRRFRSPKKKDPHTQQAMLKTEQRAQMRHQTKYITLQRDLDTLEIYNPLDELKHIFHPPKDDPGEKDPRNINYSMNQLAQAFTQDFNKYMLEGLDPNSPEALKLCRYIRKKEEEELKEKMAAHEDAAQRQNEVSE